MDAPADPLELWQDWYDAAVAREPSVPDAFALATATAQGVPTVRMLLIKGVDAAGFVFYTNLDSRKGEDLAANPRAAMCFHWKSLARQVRVEGPIHALPAAEADAYFASRDRGSRIGAWASRQSRPLASRAALEGAVAETEARFGAGEIPRPDFWSGFRLVPERLEFWEERPARLHDRIEYLRADGRWTQRRLYP